MIKEEYMSRRLDQRFKAFKGSTLNYLDIMGLYNITYSISKAMDYISIWVNNQMESIKILNNPFHQLKKLISNVINSSFV